MKANKFLVLVLCFIAASQLNSVSAQIDHWEMYVEASDNWSYFPGTQEPPSDWRQLQFSDAGWANGPGGIGYGDGDDATVLSAVNSVYMRRIFTVSNPSQILGALLYMDYDDAFVAYLNGTEIARGNIGLAGQIPTFDTYADNYNHEAQLYQGGQPENFALNDSTISSVLLTGDNVLAIQVHNFGATSSDLSAIPYLFLATSDTNPYNVQFPQWFDESDFGFLTHLPIISINTNNQQIVNEPRIIAQMKVFNKTNGELNTITDTPNEYDGQISIEIRGNSSQMFPKKSYSFETQLANGDNNNVSLLGLPEENDWVLYGPYSDKSLLRNAIVYELAREMGWYASRCAFCEVIIDNDYKGIYILMEKIKRDKNRVDIHKLDNDDNFGDSVSGGYIIKVDWSDDGVNYDWHSPVTNFDGTYLNLNYQFVYPDRDDITALQGSFIENKVSFFEQALIGNNYTDIQNGYRDYIDVHSFADYFLLQELSFNVDAFRLSNYYTKVRSSYGGKLFAGPVWDFNLGFGNADYGNGWLTSGWALENPYVTDVIPFHTKRLRQDPVFEHMLKCRWNDLRETVLSDDHIMAVIDSMTAYLAPAIERNFERWNILGQYVWPNYFVGATYEEEITYLKNYITQRNSWIDANLPGSGNYCFSTYKNKIVISEINYQDDGSIDSGDWFELYNKSSSSFDLSGWVVKDENNLNTYTIPYGTVMAAGDYLIVASNKEKFLAAYPQVNNVIGSFNWKLGNNDYLRVFDEDAYMVSRANYNNDAPWPQLDNQQNETLELLNPLMDLNDPQSWFAGCPGGSPGGPYEFPCSELAIYEAENLKVQVYPNPFVDQIIVEVQDRIDQNYEIISVDGKVLLQGHFKNNTTIISAAHLAQGYYLLKVSNKKQTSTIPIIKERP